MGTLLHPLSRPHLVVPNPVRGRQGVGEDKGPGLLPTRMAEELAGRGVIPPSEVQVLASRTCLAISTPPLSTGSEKGVQRVLPVSSHTASSCRRLTSRLLRNHGPLLLRGAREKGAARVTPRHLSRVPLHVSAMFPFIATNSSRTVCAPTSRQASNASTRT